jgi:hypothetical protein
MEQVFNNYSGRITMLLTEQQYTQAEIDEANQSAIDAGEASRAIKESKTVFINLQKNGEYVNTLDESSAYIHVSRCYWHRIGNHEEKGVTVSLISLVANNSVFLPCPQVWRKLWVYGGRAIERRHCSVMPTQDIDSTVDQFRREYEAALNA